MLLPRPTRRSHHAPLREASERILERVRPRHVRESDRSTPNSRHTITPDQKEILSRSLTIVCPHPKRSHDRALAPLSYWNNNRWEGSISPTAKPAVAVLTMHNIEDKPPWTLLNISFSLGWHDVDTPHDIDYDEHRHKNSHEHSNSNYQSLHLILLASRS